MFQYKNGIPKSRYAEHQISWCWTDTPHSAVGSPNGEEQWANTGRLPLRAGLHAVGRPDPFVGGVGVRVELGGLLEPSLCVHAWIAPGYEHLERVVLGGCETN